MLTTPTVIATSVLEIFSFSQMEANAIRRSRC